MSNLLSTRFVTDILASNTYISANLPHDIISDIFTRLPVKSLSRFKCVSKSMYAFLQNPIFIKNHLQRAIDNKIDPNLIIKLDSKLFSVDDGEWTKARRLDLPFALSLESVELSGFCSGLLCISDHMCNEDIYLYNPCTGEYNKLPIPKFDVPTIQTTCFTTLGFGYHHKQDDYKVIRFIYLYDKPLKNIDSYQCEARIYSLRGNNWKKTTDDIPFHISSRAALWLGNDVLVWKASRGFGKTMSVLVVSFDMDKEEFMEVPRPDVVGKNPADQKCHIEMGLLEGRFCLFHLWRNERVEVWSMGEFGVKESWVRMFVLGRPVIANYDEYFMYLKPLWVMNKSGEVLIEKSEEALVLCDIDKQRVRNVNIRGAPRRNFKVFAIMGSLVSPFTNFEAIRTA